MRVQQLVLGRLDALLRPHGLTFARYEALVLLTASPRAGSLPLGKMGERLQVHPTSVTSIVDRLEAAGLRRTPAAPGRRPRGAGRDHRRRPRRRGGGHRGPGGGAVRAGRRAGRATCGRSPTLLRAGAPGGRRLLTGSTRFSWTSYYLGMTETLRATAGRRALRRGAGQVPGARRRLHTLSGSEVEPAYGRRRRGGGRLPTVSESAGRGVPVHPRALRHRLPRPHLDDPAVRRLRQRRSRPTSATR